MYKCKYCNKEFEKSVSLGGHVTKCKLNPKYIELNCKKAESRTKKRIEIESICQKCGNKFKQLIKENSNNNYIKKFCSSKCSNSRNHSDKTKNKIRNSVNKANKKLNRTKNILEIKCEGCKHTFETYKKKQRYCSMSCYSKNRSSATKLKMRKNALKNNFGTKNRNKYTVGWYESKFAGKVWLESTWELKVAEYLDNNNIEWIRPKFLYWNDSGIKRRYFPDFYLKEYNLYLDPKNNFLLKKDSRKIKRVIKENKINLILIKENDIKNINKFFINLLMLTSHSQDDCTNLVC